MGFVKEFFLAEKVLAFPILCDMNLPQKGAGIDKKAALVTNAKQHVGPDAYAILLEAGFRVVCHSSNFTDKTAGKASSDRHPGITILNEQEGDV